MINEVYRMFLGNAQLVIHTANYAQVDRSWSRKEFYYPHNILYYVTNGSAKLALHDETLCLKEGCLYLLSGLAFKETVCEDKLTHYFIHFQAKTPYHDNVNELYAYPKMIEVRNHSLLIHHFKQIMETYKQCDLYGQYMSQGALRIILAPFLKDVQAPKKEVLRFIDLLTYIDEHLHEKLYIKTLAHFMSLEVTYFTHLFTETFGYSPKKYIIKKRLERGQLLLSQTDLPIKNIANKLGFENDMYFCRLFRDKTGMTPGNYRKHAYFS